MIEGGEQEDGKGAHAARARTSTQHNEIAFKKKARFHFRAACIFDILFAVSETSRTVTGDFHTLTNTRDAL